LPILHPLNTSHTSAGIRHRNIQIEKIRIRIVLLLGFS